MRQLQARLDGMLAKAVPAASIAPGAHVGNGDAFEQMQINLLAPHGPAPQPNAVVAVGVDQFDTQMQGLANLRATADARAAERKAQQQRLKDEYNSKEREIKSRSTKERAIVNPSNLTRHARLINETFGHALERLVEQMKTMATAKPPQLENATHIRQIKGRDFVSHIRFAIGSMLQYHLQHPGEEELDTSSLQALLLLQKTRDMMEGYVRMYAVKKNYADSVLVGWRSFYAALTRMNEAQISSAGGASSDGASTAGLLMPPSGSLPPAIETPHTPPGASASDATIDLTD